MDYNSLFISILKKTKIFYHELNYPIVIELVLNKWLFFLINNYDIYLFISIYNKHFNK